MAGSDQVEQALASGSAMDVAQIAETTRLAQADVERALGDLERQGRVIPAHGGRWALRPTQLEDEETDAQPAEPV